MQFFKRPALDLHRSRCQQDAVLALAAAGELLAEMRAQKERQLEGNNQRDSNRPLLPLPKLSDLGASEKTSDVSGQWG